MISNVNVCAMYDRRPYHISIQNAWISCRNTYSNTRQCTTREKQYFNFPIIARVHYDITTAVCVSTSSQSCECVADRSIQARYYSFRRVTFTHPHPSRTWFLASYYVATRKRYGEKSVKVRRTRFNILLLLFYYI